MKITIFGCGNMGGGIAQCLAGHQKIFLYDHSADKIEALEKKGYGKACRTAKEAIQASEMIILAVKPQNFQETADEIKKYLRKGQKVVSILTGISLASLKKSFPSADVIRMMPNLALLYGEGLIGVSVDENFPAKDKEALNKIFEPLGQIYWLPESKIDALTSLTGSGPAFFLIMLESMIDAGVAMGFTAKDAQQLVQKMVQGSLALLEKSEKHPGELKWQISSPGGTTIAGMMKLEEEALRSGIIKTFIAAYERARQLSS